MGVIGRLVVGDPLGGGWGVWRADDRDAAAVRRYFLRHQRGTVELMLVAGRFVVRTQGSGWIDRRQTVGMPLAKLRQFGVVPTVPIQNIISRVRPERAGDFRYDRSFDAELIFSYEEDGKVKRKRVYVDREDEDFQAILAELVRRRPEASLLHLEPRDVYRQIGVMYPLTLVYWIIGVLVGVPVVTAVGILVYFVMTGFRE